MIDYPFLESAPTAAKHSKPSRDSFAYSLQPAATRAVGRRVGSLNPKTAVSAKRAEHNAHAALSLFESHCRVWVTLAGGTRDQAVPELSNMLFQYSALPA